MKPVCYGKNINLTHPSFGGNIRNYYYTFEQSNERLNYTILKNHNKIIYIYKYYLPYCSMFDCQLDGYSVCSEKALSSSYETNRRWLSGTGTLQCIWCPVASVYWY